MFLWIPNSHLSVYHLPLPPPAPSPPPPSSISLSLSLSPILLLAYFSVLVFLCDREITKTLVSETEYQKANILL